MCETSFCHFHVFSCQVMKNEELGLPVQLVREWQDHAVCGPEFRSWLATFQKDHKVIDEQAANNKDEEKDGKKRNGDSGPGPSPKKLRTDLPVAVDPSMMVDNTDITAALINEYSLPLGKDMSVSVQFRAEEKVYLVNKGAKAWTAADPLIAHFGNGSWKVLKTGQDLPDCAVELKFGGHSDKILLNGAVQTIGQALSDMRQKKPDAKVAYHAIQENSDDVKKFSLTTTHRVCFVYRIEDGAEMSSKNIAGKLWKVGQESPLKVLWYCRWCSKGLSPIKPALHLLGSLQLKNGQAALLSGSP
jgi:hypothetical protein